MLFVVSKIRQHLLYLYEQDKKSYKQMLSDRKKKLTCINKEDIEKIQTLSQYQTLICLRQKHVVKVLKSYVAENVNVQTFMEQLFECEFDEILIKNILLQEDFVRFAMKSNLVNRILGLEYDTDGQVKLRIYALLLNYNKLKKELA